MQCLTLLLSLSGLLPTAAFPQHSHHRRDLQILTPPPIDQAQPLYPSLSEPYTLAADQFEPPQDFLPSSSLLLDTTFSKNNYPTILNPEPTIDTTYCTDQKVLVCCPQQNSLEYQVPKDGFLAPDCRLAAQYGVEFGKYPCRCCGGFFGLGEIPGEKPLGTNCGDVMYTGEGTGGRNNEGTGGSNNEVTGGSNNKVTTGSDDGGSGAFSDGGRGEYEGSWP